MADSSGGAFPTSGMNIGHLHQHTDGGLYKYLGGTPKYPETWILIDGQLQEQPDITGWGVNQRGAKWYVISKANFYGWNGIQIITIG